MHLSKVNCSLQKGFTLIEILVAALVLAIGILGMTTMMLSSLKSDQSAYYRSLASAYAYDMADRIRKNQDWARDNPGYDAINTNNDAPGLPTCVTDAQGCDKATLVDLDIREWTSNFKDVQSLGATFRPSLPNGNGTVDRGLDNVFTITVSWNEVDWDENDLSQRTSSNESISLNLVL